MSDLTWWQKARIGALGGLGLAVLKLIDQKFFLGSITSVEASAARTFVIWSWVASPQSFSRTTTFRP